MQEDNKYIELMDQSIKSLFRDALRVSFKSPSMAYFIFRTIRWQKKAAKLRMDWERRGTHVPPFMIASITSKCNLQCKGCYSHAQHRSAEEEMSDAKLRSVLQEAHDLGISIALLAGGEPLVRPGILDITRDFPQMIFPIFTNGLLLNDELVGKLEKQKNVVPVISLEGYEGATNDRRGEGVYQHLEGVLAKIQSKGIFYGISLTLTRSNFATVTSDEFIERLMGLGSKLFFFVEYIPVKAGTEDWVLTDEQRTQVLGLMSSLREKFQSLFIAFPGDEEAFGGCLSAGRGFIHISPSGNVEPCPFAPYSDTNLREMSLQDALKSGFLRVIRQQHDKLSERDGGCALWENREWVQAELEKQRKI